MKVIFCMNKGGAVRIKWGVVTQQLWHVRGLGGCATFFEFFLGPVCILGRVPVRVRQVNARIIDASYKG